MLTICRPVASFLQCVSVKNYANWFTVDKVIASIKTVKFSTSIVTFHTSSVLVYAAISSASQQLSDNDQWPNSFLFRFDGYRTCC